MVSSNKNLVTKLNQHRTNGIDFIMLTFSLKSKKSILGYKLNQLIKEFNYLKFSKKKDYNKRHTKNLRENSVERYFTFFRPK